MSELIEKMLTFTDEMHNTTFYSRMNYSREITAKNFEMLISANQFIYITDGCLMLGTLEKTFFGDNLVASDTILYVKKSHRGKGESVNAIKEFISWAENKGANNIIIGQSTGVNNKEFNKMSARCGFKKLGDIFAR